MAKSDAPRTYLFDLDSTITKEELLPRIGTLNGTSDLLRRTTREAMLTNGGFSTSFLERIDLLSEIPVVEAQTIVESVPILEDLMKWIQTNNHSVYLVTGNLDLWLQKFLIKYRLKAFTSKAILKNGKVCVTEILNKVEVLANFSSNEVIYVGDGSNDVEIMRNSDIGILTEIVHKAPTSLWEVADFAVKDEEALCKLLSRL